MDDQTLKAIKILALKSVRDPDYEAAYRKICRWYSRQFSTPLPDVNDLPEAHILQTFFEDQFATMDEDPERRAELDNVLNELLADSDQENSDIAEDDQWAEEMKREIDAQNNPNLQKVDIPEHIEINAENDRYFSDDE